MSSESQRVTQKSASNLALAFVLLPKEKRQAMAALYAFCREVDDVADEENKRADQRRAELAAWRADVQAACSGSAPRFPVNQELQPIISRHRLKFELFDGLIKGCEMDLDTTRYEQYSDLELYCYRVASVVGLLSIEIFGYRDPLCQDYAINLGKALQFTNILRDVRVDAERGRIYLPLSELKRFHVAPEEILAFQYSDRYARLAASMAEQAANFYGLARAALPAGERKSMIAAELMGAVYWRLLLKLKQQRFDVFGPNLTRLSKFHKLLLILRTWLRVAWGMKGTNYG